MTNFTSAKTTALGALTRVWTILLVSLLVELAVPPQAGAESGANLRVLVEPGEAAAAGAQWRRAGTTRWFDSNAVEAWGVNDAGQCSVPAA